MAQTAQINIKVDGKQAEGSVDGLNTKLGNTTKTTQSLRTELRQVTQELQGLEPGSARFQELTQRAGQLRDTIKDTNAVINATAGNVTENLARGLGTMTQIGIQGFQGIVAGAQILGFESENLQKTMVLLQSTMALTQTIEFFGGLGDKITEVKASFGGLLETLGLVNTAQKSTAVGATATAAAETAQGTAALGAASATGVLTTALNALPFIAIVAAIGLAVTALIKFMEKSKQASEEQKKRNEELKRQKELTDQVTSSVAKEGTQMISMLETLKNTNKGSKERSELIKTINEKYGTHLKNLQDEKLFQDQINKSIQEYVTQMKNKVAFQVNEDAMTKAIQKQLEVRRQIDETTKSQQENEDKLDKIRKKFAIGNEEKQKAFIEIQKQQIINLKQQDEQLTKQIDDLGKIGSEYFVVDKAVKSVVNTTDKYRNLLEGIKDILDREANAQRQLNELRIGEYSNLTKKEQDFAKIRLDNEEFRTQLIEGAIKRELQALDDKFLKGKMSEEEYIKQIDNIRKNGYDSLLESEKKLLDEKTKVMNKEIQMKKDGYEQQRVDAINSTKITQDEIEFMTLEFNKELAIREIQQSEMNEEQKQQAILKVKQDYFNKEKQLLLQQEQDRLKSIDNEQTKALKNFEGSEEEKKDIISKFDKQRLDVTQSTIRTINKLEDDSVNNLTQSIQQRAQELSKFINTYGGQAIELFGTINEYQQQQTEQTTSRLEENLNMNLANLQRLRDADEISSQEYEARKVQLENQTQQLVMIERRKAFQKQKAFNIANAIMTGALAVLNGLATPPLVPLGLIMAGVAGATTAVQVATISQQQFQAARGGIVPSNGLPGDVDSVNAKLAPGEAVINSRSTSMFPNTLSLINQAGGGVPLTPEITQQGSSGSATIFRENSPQQPIRAYVVETEITDTQRRVDRIQRSVEF